MDKLAQAKKAASEKACEFVRDGMLVGLGTGSTAEFVIKRLGELVATGLKIQGVPSSIKTKSIAEEAGILLIPYEDFISRRMKLDIAIDGADRVDPNFNLIKGGGGAHTREKAVAKASKEFICVVDETKLVKNLAGSFPLPVEVKPEMADRVAKALAKYGTVSYRRRGNNLFITDDANYILDVSLFVGEPLARLEVDLNEIPGVVDNGLFAVRRPDAVIVGYLDGRVDVLRRRTM